MSSATISTPRVPAQAHDGVSIRISDVGKSHPGPHGPVSVLTGLSFTVEPGEAVAVVGRSGSGKSTLLHLIAGLDRPTDGSIDVGGVRVDRLTPRRSAQWRARSVGIVFQFFQLLPTLTLVENTVLPMDLAAIGTPRGRMERATYLLDRLGLAAQMHRRPADVSGGEQQRAALARAIANDPPLLLADEPTGNLDTATAASVHGLLTEMVAAGRTLILVTHDEELARRTGRTVTLGSELGR